MGDPLLHNRALTRTHYQDYVQPARQASRPPPISASDLQIILGGLRPEVRDAIMAHGQSPRVWEGTRL